VPGDRQTCLMPQILCPEGASTGCIRVREELKIQQFNSNYLLKGDQMKHWRCIICDYVHEGEDAPAACPVCGVDATNFEEVA
jgi:rubrerythrin